MKYYLDFEEPIRLLDEEISSKESASEPSKEVKKEIAKRLLTTNQKPWITIPDAMKKIDDLRAKDDTDKKFLNDYDLFIQDLESQHKTNL